MATYGSTSVTVADSYDNPQVIRFSRPVDVPIYVNMTLRVFTGYTTTIGDQIKSAIAGYINALSIGDDVLLSRVYSPANLGVVNGGDARFYDTTELKLGRAAASVIAANVITAYDESPTCSVNNIAITVVP